LGERRETKRESQKRRVFKNAWGGCRVVEGGRRLNTFIEANKIRYY